MRGPPVGSGMGPGVGAARRELPRVFQLLRPVVYRVPALLGQRGLRLLKRALV